MSVWNDIRKQSAGKQMRQEDEVEERVKQIMTEMSELTEKISQSARIPANYIVMGSTADSEPFRKYYQSAFDAHRAADEFYGTTYIYEP